MGLIDFAVLSFTSLFVIVDPLGLIPTFLAMTERDTGQARARMAALAAGIAGGTLLLFTWTGPLLFKAIGISPAAFEMAGGIILLLIALDMLRARQSPVKETPEESAEGLAKEDIAITPLAIPMLAGPGAITATIMLAGRAATALHHLVLAGSIVAVTALSWLILRTAGLGAQRLSLITLKIMTRLMGLLLAAIAVQFMFNALQKGLAGSESAAIPLQASCASRDLPSGAQASV